MPPKIGQTIKDWPGKMVFSLMSTPPKYDTNVSLSSMKEQGYEYWCMKHRTKHPVPTVSDSMKYENVCERLIGNTIYWYFSDVVDESLPDFGKGAWFKCLVQAPIEPEHNLYCGLLLVDDGDKVQVNLLFERESWFFFPTSEVDTTLEAECHDIMDWDNGPFSKDKEPRDTETVASSKSAKGSRGSKRRNFRERGAAAKKSKQKNVAAIKHKKGKAPASQKGTTRKSKKKKQKNDAGDTEKQAAVEATRDNNAPVVAQPNVSLDIDSAVAAPVKIRLRVDRNGSLTAVPKSDADDADTELNTEDVIAEAAAEDAEDAAATAAGAIVALGSAAKDAAATAAGATVAAGSAASEVLL